MATFWQCPVTSWLCPVSRCTDGPNGEPWRITESAATVEALVIAYAHAHDGELPGPFALARLRREHVTANLDEHLRGHSEQAVMTWLGQSSQPVKGVND